MTARDAFKIGFLLRCADAAMPPAAVTATMQKAAALMEKRAFGFSDLAPVGNLAIGAGIAAPAVAGAGIGYLASQAASPEVDEEDVRKRELIDELRHYARRAREKQKAKTLRHI
jgi:hypothetical protein